MSISMAEGIEKARVELNKLTGLEISSTLEAARENGEWQVKLEVVEKHSIPDGMDILATYETRLDIEGNMLGFNRTRMRRRIDMEESEE